MEPLFKPLAWSLDASLYEVNLRQYSADGTFASFEGEIPRLRDMGVKVLWFMPITPISLEKRLGALGSYYACSDYTAANPEFGTVDDFKRLVAEAHRLGMKVIIDWVANHTGWDHRWTISNPEFYKKNAAGLFYDNNGWMDVIDLNYYDHAMRSAMIASMEFWVKNCDIDGFRCDMAHLVPLDFWRQARIHLDAIKPLFWLAETEHVNYRQVFDCSYAWKWMHLSEKFAKGQVNLDALKNLLQEYLNDPSRSTHLFFTSNHDENSWNGTEYEKYGDMALCFAVLSCTWSGLPLIYSGQEIPNHKRLKFFDKDPILWEGINELQDFYARLLKLRDGNPALSSDRHSSLTRFISSTADNAVIGYLRSAQNREVLVLLNFSGAPQHLQADTRLLSGTYKDVFTGAETSISSGNNFTIAPWGFLVFEK